jgi:tripartite-type tricarboxylate transporter receptor subunit TctC
MQTSSIRRRAAIGALCCLTFASASAWAQYPTRAIRLVVPFNAGPGPDNLARITANKLQEQFGWNVVVDNKPGAGGNIGTNEVAKARADGYTLLFGHVGALAVNPTIYTRLPFDPKKDLVPISMVATSPLLLVTGKSSPYRNLSDVLAAARRQADTVSYGYSGTGTIAHLSGAALGKAAGTTFRNIPYKTAAQGVLDLAAGRLALYMSSAASLSGYVRDGKLHAIAITSAQRDPDLPDVPSVAEQAIAGFDASTWFALMAPAGTPEEVVRTLNEAVTTVLKDPDTVERFRSVGAVTRPGSPAALASYLDAEVVRWGKVATESGAKVE